MNFSKLILFFFLLQVSCQSSQNKNTKEQIQKNDSSNFILSFGSCNNQVLPNNLWKAIEKHNPTVWIWGGDVIYSDTNDMKYLQKNYDVQLANEDYKHFSSEVDILGTWDDHDYGLNDGGEEYEFKKESQQLFLNFLKVKKEDPRRLKEGVYFSKNYIINEHSIKVIILDTRYFRTKLTAATDTSKRYKPSNNPGNTMLGEKQWEWLSNELKTSTATFNVIMSSIQFLSNEHGFECWGTMPTEIKKLEELLLTSKAKNTIILSGDRHISEFSKKDINGLDYPLIDFTSSGLTHSYTNFTEEPNAYRIGNVVSIKSFGLLKFNFLKMEVLMEIRGEENKLLESLIQKY
ncbi:alkaline phosphatase D family protein [Lutibacter sp.]|uniref:alkaline phosphatase D family protein n=1 Tax=Lutibacter sp. TaxID=1925666 RepID=UPI0027357096|nr:alkaline phosphatase D family protein [Lutibacter sp.]MDP3311799.1 alkaline phosphatase D family protein [Lutibacter sp.]